MTNSRSKKGNGSTRRSSIPAARPQAGAPSSKIQNRAKLAALVKQRKAAGKKVVFTNGCFDLLHLGHVRYLQAARSLGDFLILGLNSDESVRRLKGSTRPLVP